MKRHGQGSGDHDRAPAQRRGPVPLLRVGAFERHGLILTLVMEADRQRLVVDDEAIRTVQADLPVSKPVQQAAKGFVVAATALPIDRLTGIAIVSLPNPDFVALALKEMPHLVQFDHDGLARLRLGTIVVKVAADPAQDGLRGRPKKSGNGPEVHDHRRLTAARLTLSGVPGAVVLVN